MQNVHLKMIYVRTSDPNLKKPCLLIEKFNCEISKTTFLTESLIYLKQCFQTFFRHFFNINITFKKTTYLKLIPRRTAPTRRRRVGANLPGVWRQLAGELLIDFFEL